MTVFEILKRANGRPVPRGELCAESGLPDRKMRKEIEELRHDGVFIANNQDGSGYYLIADDDKETLEAMRAQMTKRAKNLLHQASQINKKLKQMEVRQNGI